MLGFCLCRFLLPRLQQHNTKTITYAVVLNPRRPQEQARISRSFSPLIIMNAPPPRQSLFPGAAPNFSQGPISTSHLSSLSTSLQSLRQSVDVLHHTNGLLQRSVADVPRLTTVLTAKRHYDVVTEGKVMQAKKQLEEEVRPHINELIRRAEEMVGAEEAAAKRARNKVSILELSNPLLRCRH